MTATKKDIDNLLKRFANITKRPVELTDGRCYRSAYPDGEPKRLDPHMLHARVGVKRCETERVLWRLFNAEERSTGYDYCSGPMSTAEMVCFLVGLCEGVEWRRLYPLARALR